MKVEKRFENEVFIIDEKDSELFERAKEQSDDIYFLIENLEFLRVGFVIESDMKKELENIKERIKELLATSTINKAIVEPHYTTSTTVYAITLITEYKGMSRIAHYRYENGELVSKSIIRGEDFAEDFEQMKKLFKN